MKTLRRVAGAAAVVLAVCVVLAVLFLGVIVKAAAERGGSAALGVPVTVDSVRISLVRGRAGLRGLAVGNPEGFVSPHALRLGAIDVEMRLSSLFGQEIVIERIRVEAPEVSLEIGKGGSNLGALSRNAQGGTSAPPQARPVGKEKPSPEARETGKKPEKRVIIRELTIEDGKILLTAGVLTAGTRTIPLPSIRMENIGAEGGGVSPREAMERVLAALAEGAGKVALGAAAIGLDPASAGEAAREGLRSAGESGGRLLKEAGGLLKGLTK